MPSSWEGGKLHADGARIKHDIQEYEILSQQVMQLTKIISDSVASISKTPATNGSALPSIGWRNHELLPKDFKHERKAAEEDDKAD